MSIGDIIEVDVSDIQEYVQNQANGQNSGIKQSERVTSQPNTFTVSQSDYIDYQIYLKDSKRKEVKDRLFWSDVRTVTVWLAKCLASIFIAVGMCFLFYTLVWTMQNYVHSHIQQFP